MRPLLFLALSSSFTLAADLPDPAVITAAMKKAVTYAHTHLAREGGYASSYDKEGKIGEVEHAKSPTIISIQPPGTTTMGLVILKAYQATGDDLFLNAAKDAAKALLKCQLASGGWDSDFDFDPEKAKKYYLRSDLDANDFAQAGFAAILGSHLLAGAIGDDVCARMAQIWRVMMPGIVAPEAVGYWRQFVARLEQRYVQPN